ncbi:DUF2795 domain-containing protein [Dictyobacter kobayashii]|uniref:DUF2795 domain-containing protein n=1 Tax=Dictyobacter kobayashii TaxID=2014872 RepID=A0A402AQE9_9CHLR|nr:DUF2795 domain-containing protein [Dictyobacter kobayashii]GCE21230.1 hypothetical protein KDK_50300 [Dictyobacter kobayashii]
MANVESTHIEGWLKDMKWPANRSEIVAFAQRQGADDQAVSQLRRISDQSYNSVSEVVRALGSSQSQGQGDQNRAGSRNQH